MAEMFRSTTGGAKENQTFVRRAIENLHNRRHDGADAEQKTVCPPRPVSGHQDTILRRETKARLARAQSPAASAVS